MLTEDMKLSNTDLESDWKYGDRVWSIPEKEGYLMVIGTSEVLGAIKGNVVTLQPKEKNDNANQVWLRHNVDSYYKSFILINKKSGLLLSGKRGTSNPTIGG